VAITRFEAKTGNELTYLSDLHVPENGRSEPENIADIFSEHGRLDPFSPWYIGYLAESNLLNFIGELQTFCLIGRVYPVADKLLKLRDSRPAEPAVRACARDAKDDGGIDNVCRLPPSVK